MYEYLSNTVNYRLSKVSLLLLLVTIDQLAKHEIRVNGGFYVCNQGIAFGIPISSFLLVLFSFFILFLGINLKFNFFNLNSISNFKFPIKNYYPDISLAILLIISGAISNIIDRLYLGCVIDYIDFHLWPVFNLADVYITIGGIILITKIKGQ